MLLFKVNRWEKNCNIYVMAGYLYFFVMTVSNERIRDDYSNVTRATLLYTVFYTSVMVRCNRDNFFICNGKEAPVTWCSYDVHQSLLGRYRWGLVGRGYKVHILYRVPQCMSPRQNWDSPTSTLSPASVPLPPEPRGGTDSPAGEGLGESQFRRLEKCLSLCLLCGVGRSEASWV